MSSAREHYLPILGELDGRERIPLISIPEGIEAVSVPLCRDGKYRIERDRRGRIRVTRVDLVPVSRTPFFDPPKGLPTADLVWILARPSRRWSSMEGRFRDKAWEVALALVRAGGVVLRCGVNQDTLQLAAPESWTLSHSWREQAPDALAELRPTRDPDVVRTELLELMYEISPTPPMMHEGRLLAQAPPGSSLTVHTSSVTTAKSWVTYEAAFRAACAWVGMDRMPTDVELAGIAWGNTHFIWNVARKIVFSQLVGEDFSEAVTTSDRGIRLRGPLSWQQGTIIADASRSHPWIELPIEGMRLIGELRSEVRGIFLVENADTFQEVSTMWEVYSRWVCIWGKGKAIVNAIDLIGALPGVPIAAWMDLDAAGLEIFSILRNRLERDITPIGMDLHLLIDGSPRKWRKIQDQRDAIEANKKLAASVAGQLPDGLKEVAEYIAKYGKSVEQQTLHNILLPDLPRLLRNLEL